MHEIPLDIGSHVYTGYHNMHPLPVKYISIELFPHTHTLQNTFTH